MTCPLVSRRQPDRGSYRACGVPRASHITFLRLEWTSGRRKALFQMSICYWPRRGLRAYVDWIAGNTQTAASLNRHLQMHPRPFIGQGVAPRAPRPQGDEAGHQKHRRLRASGFRWKLQVHLRTHGFLCRPDPRQVRNRLEGDLPIKLLGPPHAYPQPAPTGQVPVVCAARCLHVPPVSKS